MIDPTALSSFNSYVTSSILSIPQELICTLNHGKKTSLGSRIATFAKVVFENIFLSQKWFFKRVGAKFAGFKFRFKSRWMVRAANPPNPLTNIQHKRIAQDELYEQSPRQLDHDWGLKKYFGKIFVINLDKDQKRLESITNELKKVGIEKEQFERFKAVYGATDLKPEVWNRIRDNSFWFQNFGKEGLDLDKQRKSQAGIWFSHRKIIEKAKCEYDNAMKLFVEAKKNFDNAPEQDKHIERHNMENAAKKVQEWSSVLILEDDNGFGIVTEDKKNSTLKNTGTYFRKAIKELPEDWDMVYLMSAHFGGIFNTKYCVGAPQSSSKHLRKLEWGVCLNAYAVNAKMYDRLLEVFRKIDNPNARLEAVDNEIAALQSSSQSFVLGRPLAYQYPEVSSVTQKKGEELWDGTWNRGY
jgi:GR25 family glycosyltransferase involved in LPS biosynthesis